jgi:hypothetical protein
MSWQKRPALHNKTFYSSHGLSCSLGYPSSQLVAFIPHFINLGGTEIPKKGSQLHSFTRDKQQYVDSLRKESTYYASNTMGYGSRVGRRTGQKIAGQQDIEPNMAECSYSGTLQFFYSKPSRTSVARNGALR